MKLIIFDLDQTLVDSIEFHDRATVKIFRQFFGIEAHLTEVDLAGKSLTYNFSQLARLKGIHENIIQEKLLELLLNYDRAFTELLPPNATEYVLPGAKSLLEKLTGTDNLIMLYTGDSPAVTNALLKVTKLDKYFKYSFYGTEVTHRSDMVWQAIAKAAELANKRFHDKDIVIIGDSLRDIECGKEFNALVIAVATGFHSAAQLKELKPDYLFKSLRDSRKILKAIG